MAEPRELHPIQFFGPDSRATFDRDFSFTPEKVDEPQAGQPEPKHDPVTPFVPGGIPVPAPDAEPIPVPAPNGNSDDMAGSAAPPGPVSPVGPPNPSTATGGGTQVA